MKNVFKALEFGAIDFVEKPDMIVPGDETIKEELLIAAFELDEKHFLIHISTAFELIEKLTNKK